MNDDRTTLTITKSDGTQEVIVGLTYVERKALHDAGKCDAFCGFCWREAMLEIDNLGI